MAVCQAEMVAVAPMLPRTARPTEVPTWREALTRPDAAFSAEAPRHPVFLLTRPRWLTDRRLRGDAAVKVQRRARSADGAGSVMRLTY